MPNKKLFVSVPMKGRGDKDIEMSIDKMWKIAETIVGEDLDLIPTKIQGMIPDSSSKAIFCLGHAIKMMADADYVITVGGAWQYGGCEIEERVANHYGIPVMYVDMIYVCPDVVERERQLRENAVPVCDCGEVGFR